MSFDLAFWWEPQAISSDEAARKYHAMVELRSGVVLHNDRLDNFFDELTENFPDLTEENLDDSPWSAPLYRTSECVIVSMDFPSQGTMVDFLLWLSSGHGVTCFDPQAGEVFPPGENSGIALEMADGRNIVNPDQGVIELELRKLSDENWYLIAEKRPGWYVQVGYGTAAGVRSNSFVVEFREGGPRQHFRAVLDSIDAVRSAFLGFVNDQDGWRERLPFYRVSV
ncbi:hypothetical protein ACWEF6_11035 [Amycolatopsis sp. NPDC004772]